MEGAIALAVGVLEAGGGGGLSADLKTFESLGVAGAAAATALAVSQGGVLTILHDVPAAAVREQLRAAREAPSPHAVKVGLLTTVPVIRLLATELALVSVPLVLDPEMTGGREAGLLRRTSLSALVRELLPAATVVTPNLPEASVLAGFPIRGEEDAKRAARAIQSLGPRAVLIKGGQGEGDEVVDGLLDGRTWSTWRRPRLGTRHVHGVGGTLSAALTAYLSRGETLPDAVAKALAYTHRALASAPGLAAGCGPLGHRAAGAGR
jgi:hydroxymethylpyrimidine/phosphomethylpyrimidine kinase